ncbi:MAG: CaiB/BaiF CoA transferase family protein [Acidimicrobiia bacterium]
MTISDAPGPGPLEGLRVIDLSTMIAGSILSAWLGDFGAEVVKVEHPEGGDPLRKLGSDESGGGWWDVMNRNKRGITLKLSDPEGAGLLRRLVAGADVVVENFRPGTLERWDLGYEQLSAANPALVLTRVSGFGQTGPNRLLPAYGTLLEGYSGFALTLGEEGDPPVLPPYGLGDHVAASFGAFGTVMAVMEARRSGQGQVVDVSLYEPLLALLGPLPELTRLAGAAPARTGNRTSNAAPRNSYATKDGWIVLSAATDRLFANLMEAIGRPELATDPRFATNQARLANVAELDAAIEAWTRDRTRAEVVELLGAAGAPVGAVNDLADVLADAHVAARRSLRTATTATGGEVLVQAPVPRLSRTPGEHRRPAPVLSGSTDEVLSGELGLDADEIARLRAAGVVR